MDYSNFFNLFQLLFEQLTVFAQSIYGFLTHELTIGTITITPLDSLAAAGVTLIVAYLIKKFVPIA